MKKEEEEEEREKPSQPRLSRPSLSSACSHPSAQIYRDLLPLPPSLSYPCSPPSASSPPPPPPRPGPKTIINPSSVLHCTLRLSRPSSPSSPSPDSVSSSPSSHVQCTLRTTAMPTLSASSSLQAPPGMPCPPPMTSPPPRQHLIFAGKQLQDSRMLVVTPNKRVFHPHGSAAALLIQMGAYRAVLPLASLLVVGHLGRATVGAGKTELPLPLPSCHAPPHLLLPSSFIVLAPPITATGFPPLPLVKPRREIHGFTRGRR